MLRAIELAQQGLGFTSPNPPVGALLVSNNKIISEGFHKQAGCAHAEVEALKNINTYNYDDLSLYVTLEPCSHYGKTPPCLKLILKSNIKKIYIGIKDPNPKVNGKSISSLKNHGIKVEVLPSKSNLSKKIRTIMKFFLKSCVNDLPYVTLKAGTSLDSKIATSRRESKWITNKTSRENSRMIRSQYDAIVIGSGTVIADNPSLKPIPPIKTEKY